MTKIGRVERIWENKPFSNCLFNSSKPTVLVDNLPSSKHIITKGELKYSIMENREQYVVYVKMSWMLEYDDYTKIYLPTQISIYMF